MMKVLVTGGAGYIGSHTIIEILENRQGWQIISADNFSTSTEDSFQRIANITGNQITNYRADLTDEQDCETLFRENPDLDAVIHFAALKAVGESVADPILYYRNNLQSLLNVLACCKKYQVNRFIFSSSCTVYGNIGDIAISENQPLGTTYSPYGETKAMGERIIRDFVASNPNFKAILLRYFNPVGAHLSGLIGENPKNKPNNLVPVITQVAAGLLPGLTVFGTDYPTRDGSCVRDYVHVSDIASAHVRAIDFMEQMKKEGNQIEVFNLGTGNGVTVLEAIQAFERVSGLKLNYSLGARRPGDLASSFANPEKAKMLMGWRAIRSIDEMMASAWLWQQNYCRELCVKK